MLYNRRYPFWDDRHKILWPGRYPNAAAVQRLLDGLSHRAWEREYLLDATAEHNYSGSDKRNALAVSGRARGVEMDP